MVFFSPLYPYLIFPSKLRLGKTLYCTIYYYMYYKGFSYLVWKDKDIANISEMLGDTLLGNNY